MRSMILLVVTLVISEVASAQGVPFYNYSGDQSSSAISPHSTSSIASYAVCGAPYQGRSVGVGFLPWDSRCIGAIDILHTYWPSINYYAIFGDAIVQSASTGENWDIWQYDSVCDVGSGNVADITLVMEDVQGCPY